MEHNKQKWSPEMEQMLIEEVRKRDCLWNVRSPLFKLRTLKQSSYFDISKTLRHCFPCHADLFNPKLVNAKFTALKGIYMKNKKKYKNLPSGSAGELFVPWVHYSTLTFLEDVVEPTQSSSNLDTTMDPQDEGIAESQEVDDPGTFNETFSSTIELESESGQHPTTPRNSTVLEEVDSLGVKEVTKKRKRNNKEDELIAKACKTIEEIRSAPPMSHADIFGTYVASRLKNMTKEESSAAEAEILKVLLNFS